MTAIRTPKYDIFNVRDPQSDINTSSSGPKDESTSFSFLSTRKGTAKRGPPNARTPGTSSVASCTRRTPWSAAGTSGLASRTPAELHTANIVALVEGRGLAKGEIGMASINVKSPTIVLSQFSDSQTYSKVMTKLHILNPVEIIFPNTVFDKGNMTSLCKQVSEVFAGTTISTVQRKYFNETKGLETIKHLCVPEFNSVEMEVVSKYYCLACASALIKYVEFVQNTVYIAHSMKIVYQGCENTVMIDSSSAKHLELIQNVRDPKSPNTLFGVLNYTKTPGGARFLRSNILQPPADLETIRLRLETVTELTEREDLFYHVQSVIGRFLDIDHLLSLCVQAPKQETVKSAENKISNVIYLKHTLELVDPLRNALKESSSTLLRAYHTLLEDPRYMTMYEKITAVIHDDTRYQKGSLNLRTQKCFAVKPNINGLLDVARQTYTELVDDVTEMCSELSRNLKLPIKVSYNCTRGFYLQMHVGGKNSVHEQNLPDSFIKVTKYKNTLSFTTADFIRMNDRIRESLQEIYMMSNVVVSELLSKVREDIGCLYKLTESLALIDMLSSFAHLTTISQYVQPDFTQTLAVKTARHPVFDKIHPKQPVANDVYASAENNFLIITGANMRNQEMMTTDILVVNDVPQQTQMLFLFLTLSASNPVVQSGKSTYLRQVALLQVMAQIGCYVPADYASFRITHQIFTRIGSDDDIESNSSTFMMEMKETKYILQNISSNSLVIIDELGRGTNVQEGAALCFAICEDLVSRPAFTFFATHFMELTKLACLYPNVENYHMATEVVRDENCERDRIIYHHTLANGVLKEDHYGLKLAEMTLLPSSIITRAKHYAEQYSQGCMKIQDTGASLENHERVAFKVVQRLVQVSTKSNLDNKNLQPLLASLQAYYIDQLPVVYKQEADSESTS